MSGPANPVIKSSDLPLRAGSGVVMIGVAIAALILGDLWFWALCAVAGLLIAAEWGGLMRASAGNILLLVAGAALPIALAAGPLAGGDLGLAARAVPAVALGVALFGRSARLGLGVLYAVLPVLALFFLRGQADGIALTLWTLAVVWATDIGAYFAGRAIGGPKLAPRLSPNKTWAGLLGGMAAALLVGFALAWATNLPWRLAGVAGALALAAQAGDLFESWLKRRAGVKDSGRLLPGHGGAMDRLDGLVPVACLVAAMIGSGWLG